MFEILNKKEIIAVLSQNVFGRLGCQADNKAYVVPISYAYDDNYIYARTFEGMKMSMMRKNPNVCFEVDKIKREGMAEWESVILWGTFEELRHPEERKKGLKILLSRILPDVASETVMLTPEWPFPTNDLDKIDGIVFRIRIKEMTGRREKLDIEKYRF